MDDTTAGEVALWRDAKNGDAGAFAAVFDLHRDRVHAHALRWLGGRDEAEDVSAAAFLELWRRRDVVRIVSGSVLPWLLVTTANLARNHERARRRYRAFLSRLPRHEAAEPGADEALSAVTLDLDPRLVAALRGLPRTDAALLALLAFEDLALPDAAAALGLTVPAAKSRLHRARVRLRDAVPAHQLALDPTGAPR